jgi:hypothetical protein
MQINFAQDSLYAQRICEHLDIEGSMSFDQMLAFFEMQCRVYDAFREAELDYVKPSEFARGRGRNPKRVNPSVTDEMRKYIAYRCRQGVRNTHLLAEIRSVFGYAMQPQYLSHLRKRMGLPASQKVTQ